MTRATVRPAITRILSELPDTYQPFEGTEYPMPVGQAILGEMPDMPKLRSWLAAAAEGEVKNACEPVAIAAEVIESSLADRDLYFMDDGRVRSDVFNGAKWRAGWVVVAGQGITDELVGKLKAARYMVFSSRHEPLRDRAFPPRETGAIYFLQLMARYAMSWGMIPPGEDHAMGHFLEKDMPGAMIVRGAVGPVEALVLLALMKMGCPAIVGPEFPHHVGPRAVARNDDEVLQALAGFPNMRVRVIEGRPFAWPQGADPAHARATIQPVRTSTGIFQLRPGHGESGVTIAGSETCNPIVVIVEVSDEKLDLPVSAHLESEAIRFGSYLEGVKTLRSDDGAFTVELAEGSVLNANLLGEVIRSGLKHKYPRLGPAHVSIRFGQKAAKRERTIAEQFERERDTAILTESEETVEEFHVCIDCQPFSHAHVCVITPDRPPMCGRSRNEVKAGALWGADYRPWTRRHVGGADLQHTIAKGPVIDAAAGEWAGIDAIVKELSGGNVERMRIHSVGVLPHTSCGCFQALAFALHGGGIGIMHRGYKGTAPQGLTWTILANRAGGKQSPGVVGIALSYLGSPKALCAEGGLAAVKWATKKVLEVMQPHLPLGARVATEEDALTLAELERFFEK